VCVCGYVCVWVCVCVVCVCVCVWCVCVCVCVCGEISEIVQIKARPQDSEKPIGSVGSYKTGREEKMCANCTFFLLS